VVWIVVGVFAVGFALSFVLRWLRFGDAAVYVNLGSKLLLRGTAGVIMGLAAWKLATLGSPWLILVAVPVAVVALWSLVLTGAVVWVVVRDGMPDE
jgi:hypothetical protein